MALAGLLNFIRAPAYPLWFVAIIASEYGIYCALAALTVFAWRPAYWEWLAAAILFLTPLLRAVPLAAKLPAQLRAAFGPTEIAASARQRPLDALALLSIASIPKLPLETVVYAPPDLTMDLYGARRGAEKPVLLVVHGGSWSSGNREDLAPLHRYLAARGYLVASIDYRLAKVARFPAPVEDVQAAITYLKLHAKELGFDGKHLVLMGRSAGGQVALAAAYAIHDPVIKGVISFYAPADMEFAFTHPSSPLVMNSRRVLMNYIGSDRLEDYRKASPVALAGPDSPPTLLIHGDMDALVWNVHAIHLTQRLHELGRPVYFLRLPWATHGADYVFKGPSGQLSTYAIERFLAATMNQR